MNIPKNLKRLKALKKINEIRRQKFRKQIQLDKYFNIVTNLK